LQCVLAKRRKRRSRRRRRRRRRRREEEEEKEEEEKEQEEKEERRNEFKSSLRRVMTQLTLSRIDWSAPCLMSTATHSVSLFITALNRAVRPCQENHLRL
jgi:hypothetical protein